VAPAETAEEADDDALDEAFLQELAGDGAETLSAGEDAVLDD